MSFGVGVQVPREKLSFFGTASDRREALIGGVVALGVTVGYTLVAGLLSTPTTSVEFLSLWTSLACVWLARTENIWAMPYGLAAVLLLGWFLLGIELVAQGWLQYLFYVPVQILGWWAWARGGSGRTELPITRLGARGWLMTVGAFVALWAIGWWTFGRIYESSAYLGWDTSIVAASVVAQSLMTWKKRECWWAWTIPVNVSSIALFVVTGAWAFVFLYVVFLANSIWGWRLWTRREASRR